MDVYLDPGALAQQLAQDVGAGLSATPKVLAPKYFYDARGSELFDEITRLPEYYPTRTERAILEGCVDEIAGLTGARTLIELGSGTSEKTKLLLRALRQAGSLERFVPFDVDPAVLKDAAGAVSAEFAGVTVEPIVGDFERHLGHLPRHPKQLLAFLGSTIGNLEPAPRAAFLTAVRAGLGEGDAFLLGTDLVKSPQRLVAAYDDTAGVTAAFNKNLLAVLNRDLGADFEPDEFDHVAVWNSAQQWIEMRLRSRRDQLVHIAGLGRTVPFTRGEDMRTEISAKFRPAGVQRELARAGLRLVRWWTDPAGDFGLSLSVPA
jgi:L-histidine N-alpha-methyltransferase